MEGSNWSRRKLLTCASTAAVSAIAPRTLHSLTSTQAKPTTFPLPFSRFTDIAATAGLTQPMIYGYPDHATYIIENIGGGCAFFDYDNDGWMDIFLPSGRHLEDVPPGATNRLYKNNRNGTFTDVTEKAGLLSSGWASGVCVGDYNNDGFEDLFVTFYGQNRLYRNNGDGTFTDVTAKAGLLQPGTPFGTGCTFVDYNRDGLLDLFVSNYVDIDLATAPKPSLAMPNCNYEGVPVACGPARTRTARHYLYRNNGDGTFTDVSKESGIAAVSRLLRPHRRRLRRRRRWLARHLRRLRLHAQPAAHEQPRRHLPRRGPDARRRHQRRRPGDGGMGIGVGDYDLDGHLDILKTHFQHQASGLYHNNGKAEFEDVTVKPRHRRSSTASSVGDADITDLDNDGYPDILIVCGTVYSRTRKGLSQISRHAIRASSSAIAAMAPSSSSATKPDPASPPATSAAAAPSATSTTTATSTSSSSTRMSRPLCSATTPPPAITGSKSASKAPKATAAPSARASSCATAAKSRPRKS